MTKTTHKFTIGSAMAFAVLVTAPTHGYAEAKYAADVPESITTSASALEARAV